MTLRNRILEQFAYQEEPAFSDLRKATGMRSNHLAYHLNALVEQETLEKTADGYRLSEEAEQQLPYLSDRDAPLPIVLVGCWRDQEVLLHRREKRPYKGKLSLLGGRISVEESIEQAAQRVARKLAGIEIDDVRVRRVAHEHATADGETKHAFIIFYVTATTFDEPVRAQWYAPEDIPEEQTIHSDYELCTDDDLPWYTTFNTPLDS